MVWLVDYSIWTIHYEMKWCDGHAMKSMLHHDAKAQVNAHGSNHKAQETWWKRQDSVMLHTHTAAHRLPLGSMS